MWLPAAWGAGRGTLRNRWRQSEITALCHVWLCVVAALDRTNDGADWRNSGRSVTDFHWTGTGPIHSDRSRSRVRTKIGAFSATRRNVLFQCRVKIGSLSSRDSFGIGRLPRVALRLNKPRARAWSTWTASDPACQGGKPLKTKLPKPESRPFVFWMFNESDRISWIYWIWHCTMYLPILCLTARFMFAWTVKTLQDAQRDNTSHKKQYRYPLISKLTGFNSLSMCFPSSIFFFMFHVHWPSPLP